MTTSYPTNTTPIIDTLSLFLSPSIPVPTPSSAPSASHPALNMLPAPLCAKLRALGAPRTKDMRRLGHATQVVSHIPIHATPSACAKCNDALHAGTRLHAEKFAPLALLPSGRGDGKHAAAELARCVGRNGFVGGVLGVSRKEGVGIGVDDASMEELWAAAEKYRVPIMLGEMWPGNDEASEYQAHLPESVVGPLVTFFYPAHASSPLPVLQLYLSGVFDRFPKVQLILAHPGAISNQLPRIETLLSAIPPNDKPRRSFLDIWQHNLYFTTADVLDVRSMRCLLERVPIERVLYASCYPLEEKGKDLIDELRGCGFVNEEEWEMLAWRNAEALFGMKGRGRVHFA